MAVETEGGGEENLFSEVDDEERQSGAGFWCLS